MDGKGNVLRELFWLLLFCLLLSEVTGFFQNPKGLISIRKVFSYNERIFKVKVERQRRSTITNDENVNSRTISSPTLLPVENFENSTKVQELKKKILYLAALTNRGNLHSEKLGKGEIYKERKKIMLTYVEELLQTKSNKNVMIYDIKLLEGEWELLYANAPLFRSSPFFLAIQTAFNSKVKSELFFKLHELETRNFGISSIGRITQEIILPRDTSSFPPEVLPLQYNTTNTTNTVNIESKNENIEELGETSSSTSKGKFISSFDTTIMPLTAIPIFGFFRLRPTFGGKVITTSILEKIDNVSGVLDLEVEATSFSKIEGVTYMPLLEKSLENKKVDLGKIWPKLPWNKGAKAKTSITIKYLDEDMRISEDASGAIYIYTRPI